MAAEKYLGEGKQSALDTYTVSMGHPDAQLALLGGQSEINAHFTSPPFQNFEAKDGKAHKVLDSFDVLGGPHTFNVLWAKSEFVEGNPELIKAFMAALEESMQFIKDNPEEASRIWAEAEATNMTQEEILALVTDPQTSFVITPENILPYVHFMARSGLITSDTDDWHDIFFDTVGGSDG